MIVPTHGCFLSTQNQSGPCHNREHCKKSGYDCIGALGCSAVSVSRTQYAESLAALLIAIREFHFACIEEQLDEQNELRARGIDMTELPTRGTAAAANFVSLLFLSQPGQTEEEASVPMTRKTEQSKTHKNKYVTVNDRMQKGYRYELSAPVGRSFDPEFKPELTPQQMLALGVFCGKYMTDTRKEFPKSWFRRAKLSPFCRDCSLNYFGVDASRRLSEWRTNGWIHPDDPRGWFQWYCRYYMGRRLPEEDRRQIKRWKAFRRHITQVRMNCEPGDPFCRPRQRQALLHWAYDSRKI